MDDEEKTYTKDALKRAEDDMKDAKNKYDKVEKKYEKAEEAFENWKKSNPNYSTTDAKYIELKEERDKKEKIYLEVQRTYQSKDVTYQSKDVTYQKLLDTYHDLVKETPNEDIKEINEDIREIKDSIVVMKRQMDDSITSSSNKKSSRNSSQQDNFKRKVKEVCASKCIITGYDGTIHTCHIIPLIDWKINYHKWQTEYLDECFDRKDGINDVKNGIGMCQKWHTYFDAHCFTIYFTMVGEEKKYHIKLSPKYPFSEQEKAFDGKELKFSGDSKKWPGQKFLEHHNKNFEAKQLTGGAEPQDYSRQDSDATLGNYFEKRDYTKTIHNPWIINQLDEYEPVVEHDIEMVD